MRNGFLLALGFCALPCCSSPCVAQDPTQQAIQMQQQQIVQQQMQQQQQIQQQTQLINQQQLWQNGSGTLGGYQLGARAPRFEQTRGAEPNTIVVRMKDSSRGASIFYTTDGWTPTPSSTRYLGPVTFHDNVTLRAVAIAQGNYRSYVATLDVKVSANPTAAAAAPSAAPADQPLHVSALSPALELSFRFTSSVTSRGLSVGDELPVALDQDLFVNDRLLAARGTPALALVTQIDNSHVQGLPGALSFTLKSIKLTDGRALALSGVETMEGEDRTKKAIFASIIPLGGLAVHGGDAIIPAGTRLHASVATQTEQAAQSRQTSQPGQNLQVNPTRQAN